MSDSSSPVIFGKIFSLLAANPTEEHKAIAAELYELSADYDFCDCEMEEDRACVMLGLARKTPNPYEPGETVTVWLRDNFEADE